MQSKREFNLLDQAIFYLSKAKESYDNVNKSNINEDYEIRECCLKLQYAVEIFLKGLVEQLCGCDYKHSHELVDNINVIFEHKDEINNFDELEEILNKIDNKAYRIKGFHTQAVYIDGFCATINEINEIICIAEELKTYCNNNILNIDN